jgi:hypothetical protein
VKLSEVIEVLNDRFGTEFTEADQLFFDSVIAEAKADGEVQRDEAPRVWEAVGGPSDRHHWCFELTPWTSVPHNRALDTGSGGSRDTGSGGRHGSRRQPHTGPGGRRPSTSSQDENRSAPDGSRRQPNAQSDRHDTGPGGSRHGF